MTVVALVLAAGESRRMGLPKALLAIGATSFVAAGARALARAGCHVVVVAGAHARQIAAAHPELPLAVNRRWREGQLSSVRLGLRLALRRHPSALLLHTVDAPRVTALTCRRLLAALRGHEAAIPVFEGRPGHPLALSPDGARALLRLRAQPHLEAALAHLDRTFLTVDDPGVVENVNRPEDYRRLFGAAARLAAPPQALKSPPPPPRPRASRREQPPLPVKGEPSRR